MKSKIMFILIFLLAICMIAPIAASDNGTQLTDDIKVSFNDTVYKDDLGEINVELPENTSGNLKATINDVEFYNENISSSISIPISIPQKAIPMIVPNRDTDHTNYFINLFFNNTLINSSHTLKVMKVPQNYTLQGFLSEILKDDPEEYVSLYFPESANGEIKVFIDGKFAFNLTAKHFTFVNATEFTSLPLGNHNLTVIYAGDKYYKKFNKTFNFSVVDMKIHIPANIVLEHDDCITAKIMDNKDGIVYVYFDNKLVFQDKLDKYGEFLHSMFDDVTCGEHIIEVRYNASNFSKSKKQTVNVTYYVDIWDYGSFVYGEENQIMIIVPTDFKETMIDLKIDGNKITNFKIDNSGWIEIDVSKLGVGNHTLSFDFKGNEKYGPWSESKNFTLSYSIIGPDIFSMKQEVYLRLPSNASGNLEVYINNTLYKSVKLVDGTASININTLAPGKYDLKVKYSGNDFNVTEVDEIIMIYPNIETPGEMYCGDDEAITVDKLNGAKGKVIFEIGDKNYTVDIKNGKAVLSLKNFKKGSYEDIRAIYVGDDGVSITLFTYVDILPSKIALTNLKVTATSIKVKVSINGKAAKNTHVNFKIDKKTKKVKTDKNGFATIKLNPGKHTLKVTFKEAKATKTVNVPALTLSSLNVKKSAKKVVLTAKLTKKLKNKIIKFKFNGKTIKVKTNAKGIAKATFKTSNLKVGKKITYSATYLKSTVKKTVTVKK